ncbi:MAG: hypothetical protein MH204_06140 [Fimbriimonadaceae bacterium]|nr:hypothetical protein [Fimbriimonadaceae bacterium]
MWLISAILLFAAGAEPETLRVPDFPRRELSSPMMGLAINVPDGGGAQELLDAAHEARRTGFNLLPKSIKWSDVEPGGFGKVAEDMKFHTFMGFYTPVTLQTIDTNNKTVPADLMGKAWDDPEMLARWEAFLERFIEALPADTLALSLGNEVDIRLRMKPEEIEGYLKFLAHGRRVVNRLRPTLPLGVTTTYEGVLQSPELVDRLQAGADTVFMTYYLNHGGTMKVEGEVAEAFSAMVRVAGRRPVMMQEVGCPASAAAGSSEAKQAAFFTETFRAIRRHRAQLAGVSLFIQYDFTPAQLKDLTAYYGLDAPDFVAFLNSLGLKRTDGTHRPAWDVVRREMASMTAP